MQTRKAGFNKRKASSREIEAEKKKLRKELEKLRKQHAKASKDLDNFISERNESRYPIEDLILQEEDDKATENSRSKISPPSCAAARIPDIAGFPKVSQHCIS